MDQADWLAAVNPYHMLLHVRRNAPGLRTQAGRRKFRLFACASVRRVWASLTHHELRTAVESVELFAEMGTGAERYWETRSQIRDVAWGDYPRELWTGFYHLTDPEAWSAARTWQWISKSGLNKLRGNKSVDEKARLADLTRDIFGNPFRPVVFDPAWRTSDVTALAQGIYDDHAFDRMPILADALQEAGCDNTDVLTHCRADTVHARGCWVVDGVLGKA